jgi:tetratricopeptide (TPR) repeat protein
MKRAITAGSKNQRRGVAILCASLLGQGAGAATDDLVPMAAPKIEIHAQSVEALSNACYQQSLDASGTLSSCDALIAQSQSVPVAPALLASAYSNRGLLLARQAAGTVDQEALMSALRDHESAAQLAPERIAPLINQANVLLALGRASEALVLYDKIVALPGTAAALQRHVVVFNRAFAYRALGDVERADADLFHAQQLAAAARNGAAGSGAASGGAATVMAHPDSAVPPGGQSQ